MSEFSITKYLNLVTKDYFIFTVIFFVLSFIGVLHHEIWLDEAQHWLLARDSKSIPNLITNTQYEGHPILWNILLFFISRFSLNPFWMQLLHIIISTSAIFIFFKNAPFSRIFKIVFIFGYFTFFEYNLISRNYALGMLFLFLVCSTYKYRKEKFVLFASLLALTSNTHAIFVVISCCIMLIVFIDHIQKNGLRMPIKMSIGLSIFVIGTILAIIQIIPPSDTLFFENTNELKIYQRIPKAFVVFFKGLFTIPDVRTIHFWNTNLIINLSKPIAVILCITSLLIPCFLFFKNKIVLLYVYLSFLGIILFFFITQLSDTRYLGINYLIIISGLWINSYYAFEKNKLNSLISLSFLKKTKKAIVYSILGIQLISGIFAYCIDITNPFTNAKQTITFLKKTGITNKIIVSKTSDGTELSCYLQRPIYFAYSNQYQSYFISRNPPPNRNNLKESIIKSLENLIKEKKESIVLILNEPFFKAKNTNNWLTINKEIKYKLLQKFEESIFNRNYYIYEVSKI